LCSKICGHCVHTKHKKVRSAGKGLAPLKAGHVLTPVVLTSFCALVSVIWTTSPQ